MGRVGGLHRSALRSDVRSRLRVTQRGNHLQRLSRIRSMRRRGPRQPHRIRRLGWIDGTKTPSATEALSRSEFMERLLARRAPDPRGVAEGDDQSKEPDRRPLFLGVDVQFSRETDTRRTEFRLNEKGDVRPCRRRRFLRSSAHSRPLSTYWNALPEAWASDDEFAAQKGSSRWARTGVGRLRFNFPDPLRALVAP